MNPWHIFLYAAVIAVIVRTITREELLREPRGWLESLCQDENRSVCVRKLAYMPTCEFCCSFWVTLALLIPVFEYRLIFDDWRGYLVSVFATMGVANVYMSLFNLIRVDLKKERTIAEHLERRKSA